MEKMKMHTPDITESNIEKIGQLFPNCLTERIGEDGKVERVIDFDQLRQVLSKEIVDGTQERFTFSWPDKKKALRLANASSNMALRPCREDSVNFDDTENLYIEGDNLEVLKLLREDYLGEVKMIYIDPPYNTGNDFVYEDDFSQEAAAYIIDSGQMDGVGNRLVQNTESNGRFHTDWLNMIYPRLSVCRDFLRDDGVIFISIDDNEQANLKKVCDEVFGVNNFVGILIHQRAKGGGQAKYIVKGHDYILCYAKDINKISLTRKKVIQQKTVKIDGVEYIKNDDVIRKQFGKYDKSLGDRRCFYEELVKYKGEAKKHEVDELIKKGVYFLEPNDYGMHTICEYIRVDDAKSKLYSIIKVLSEEGKKDIEDLGINGFSYPKPVDLLTQLIEAGTSGVTDSIVLDFFSGSATTAHAVLKINAEDGGRRKFIMIQLPEETEAKSTAQKEGFRNICEIGKERLRRAGEKICTELFKEEANGLLSQIESKPRLDIGFRVLKLDSSNMEDVYYRPEESSEATLFENNVKSGRSTEDLLFQVMLECNLPLSAKIKTETIFGKEVYSVNNEYLIACFDEDVNEDVIKAVAKRKPYYFVMRDSSLASDNVADNFEQIFQAYSKDTIRKIL